jgi:iron complex outermembrane recepter protein
MANFATLREENIMRKLPIWNVAALGCVIMPSMVIAQDTDNDGDQAGEIVVTAQRKAQRLTDVPIAVTAFDDAGLEKRQINSAGLAER